MLVYMNQFSSIIRVNCVTQINFDQKEIRKLILPHFVEGLFFTVSFYSLAEKWILPGKESYSKFGCKMYLLKE